MLTSFKFQVLFIYNTHGWLENSEDKARNYGQNGFCGTILIAVVAATMHWKLLN